MAKHVRIKNTFDHEDVDDETDDSASSCWSSGRRCSPATSRSSSGTEDNDGTSNPNPPYRHLIWESSEDTPYSIAGSGAPHDIPNQREENHEQAPMWDNVAFDDAASVGNPAHDIGSGSLCAPVVQAVHQETGVPIEDLMLAHSRFDLNLVPTDPTSGELLSVGTIAHGTGNCKPCLFWHKSNCNKSVACTYCHIRHQQPRFKRIKPSKRQRAERKAALAFLNREVDSDDDDAENQPETVEAPAVQAEETTTGETCGRTRIRL